jgi:hypothetical protein
MMKFFAQMLRFPITVFVSTMEVFVGAMRDVQTNTDRTINTMVDGFGQALGSAPGSQDTSADSRVTGGVIVDTANSTTLKEERQMADQDLSGTDLKYVSYSILFTKPDLEVTLRRQREELVNYSTNGESFGALKIAEFFERNALGKVERPEEWARNNYPPDATDETHWTIPRDDRRYVTFIFEVTRRLDRTDPNYPKEQVKVLKEIRDKLRL